MSSFRKSVSMVEKLYLVFNGLRPPFANQLVVEGVGTIPESSLAAAITRAAEANPGACLRMSGHLGGRAWVIGPPPRLTVIRGSRWDGRSDEGAPFLDRMLDPSTGPTCEVQLVEAGARTFLVFRSLHAVMDGLGTLLWAQDTLRALRGETLVGHPSALTDTEFAAGLRQDPLAMPSSDALHPCGKADAPSSGNDFVWKRVTIEDPAEQPMVAAIAIALADEARRHGEGSVRFNIPADLRFFRKDERSTGNVIGTLFVDVPAGMTVAALADDLKARLRAREHARFPANYSRLRWLPMGALEATLRRNFTHEHEGGRYWFTSTISYLGVVDPTLVGGGGFTPRAAFWIPPMADQTCFVSASKMGNRLELLLAMPRVFATRGRFEHLLERLTAVVARPAAARPTAPEIPLPAVEPGVAGDGLAQRRLDVVDERQRA